MQQLAQPGYEAIASFRIAAACLTVHCCIVQGREKIKLLEVFTTMGFDVLLSDVDTVW